MPLWGDILVGVVVAIGLLGTIVQVLPGASVVGAAVAIWGAVEGGQVGWTVFGAAIGLTLLSYLLQVLIPGRFMQRRGVPGKSLLVGGALAIIGFFVIPVIGMVIGFIGGIFLAEFLRLRNARMAWPATVNALKAAGLSILVELSIALLTTGAWIAGLIFG